MLVYIMEETVIGEVQKILKEEHIHVKRKFARPRLTHTIGVLLGFLEKRAYYQAYS